MAVPAELQKQLDKRHGGNWSASGSANATVTGNAGFHELEELIRAAKSQGYQVTLVAGVITLSPR